MAFAHTAGLLLISMLLLASPRASYGCCGEQKAREQSESRKAGFVRLP
jgi:hypothetical protein